MSVSDWLSYDSYPGGSFTLSSTLSEQEYLATVGGGGGDSNIDFKAEMTQTQNVSASATLLPDTAEGRLLGAAILVLIAVMMTK